MPRWYMKFTAADGSEWVQPAADDRAQAEALLADEQRDNERSGGRGLVDISLVPFEDALELPSHPPIRGEDAWLPEDAD
jgi:hypothetical protein